MSRKSKAAEFVDEMYNVEVVGRNVMVTDAMKDYAIERVSKIERFGNRIFNVSITMDVLKFEQRVDIVVKIDHIKIKSHAVSESIYTSVDMAVAKLEAQLLRYKSKIQDHHAKSVSVIDMNVNVLRSHEDQELMDVNFSIEDENKRRQSDAFQPHKVVKTEKKPLKTLSDGEALMKMDLSGDAFLIYRCEANKKFKVIYKREDLDFGVIELE